MAQAVKRNYDDVKPWVHKTNVQVKAASSHKVVEGLKRNYGKTQREHENDWSDSKQKTKERLQLTELQKRDINNARAKAVRQAWKNEQKLVAKGMGTRQWTPEQQEELLTKGKVSGFEGHHMRSVSCGEHYDSKMAIAEDPENIQFLSKTEAYNEHIRAHSGDTRNPSNGYYNVETDKIKPFSKNEKPRQPKPPQKLSCSVSGLDELKKKRREQFEAKEAKLTKKVTTFRTAPQSKTEQNKEATKEAKQQPLKPRPKQERNDEQAENTVKQQQYRRGY